jgi:hypothetical protein
VKREMPAKPMHDPPSAHFWIGEELVKVAAAIVLGVAALMLTRTSLQLRSQSNSCLNRQVFLSIYHSCDHRRVGCSNGVSPAVGQVASASGQVPPATTAAIFAQQQLSQPTDGWLAGAARCPVRRGGPGHQAVPGENGHPGGATAGRRGPLARAFERRLIRPATGARWARKPRRVAPVQRAWGVGCPRP